MELMPYLRLLKCVEKFNEVVQICIDQNYLKDLLFIFE